MKRVTLIFVVLISFLLVSQPVFASAFQSQPYSSLTASSIVPLLSHSDVTELGDIDDSKELDITVSLKLRNKGALKQEIDRAHSKKISGQIVSDQEMVTSYLPAEISQSKVTKFLQSKGLQVTRISGNRMSIKVQGSAKAIEDALNVTIKNYVEKGRQFFANSTEPYLPSAIASEIESIDGLNNLPLIPSYSRSSLTPSTVKIQYDMAPVYAANINGKGVKLAVATYCDFNLDDATYFFKTYGINVAAPITTIQVGGTPLTDASAAMETMLDIESALSTAPGAELLIYDGATPTSSTGIDVFSKIVEEGQADVVSYSWGLAESDLSASNVNAMNNLFAAGSAKGMTFMAATGDSGGSEIIYPATDPYVTAVGGTTLNIEGGSGEFVSEVGWSGSGGGVSSRFTQPSWQQGVVNASSYGRTIPDVALDADPTTGYAVYANGVWHNVGGTSGAAPHWAGIMALVDQSRADNGLGPLGLANPALYSLKVRAAYKDITSGSNGLYSCYQGYDMVTGWGSVDVAKLVNILGTYTEATAVPPRLAGATAAQTAVAIANQTGWKGTAILASSASYGMVDALTCGPLATFLKAPILLQEAGPVLNADTRAELVKLQVKTVYVASGTAVISQAVLNELKDKMQITVVSLGGNDQFVTSVNIANTMMTLGAPVSKIAVAYGWLTQDALSIASIASCASQPILLTEKDSVPASVKAFLVANPKITSAEVIGGTGVISEAVKDSFPSATRHYGNTAYDTNQQVIQDFTASLEFNQVYLANGVTGIDALSGAPLAAQTKSAIVLTDGTVPTVATFVNGKMTSNSVVTALGGTSVVPAKVLAAFTSY